MRQFAYAPPWAHRTCPTACSLLIPNASVRPTIRLHPCYAASMMCCSGDLAISGSIDRTCRLWDIASGRAIQTLRGHNDEILDVTFNGSGSR